MTQQALRQLRTWSRMLRGFCSTAPLHILNSSFATHIPVLSGLSNLWPVRRIIELGAGPHSTCNFLDRSLFPHVDRIASFENDPFWYGLVKRLVIHDRRISLRFVRGAMASAVKDISYNGVDLVFVDD